MSFSREIIHWYRANKRALPWRETNDPYCIWLSEVILQQTRVAQGTPYYFKFLKAFPTVFDLANASEEAVLKLWQGLGYYSRARNLHAAAQYVAFELNGAFPSTYKELLALKGVGDYTASAIASICFNAPEAVLDGNVFRVLSRYLGEETPINTPQGIKLFKNLASAYIDPQHPSEYNQGIMEFGALQCTPKNPNCGACPLMDSCVAFQTQQFHVLPKKLPKTKAVKLFHDYFVILDPKGKTLYNKRVGKGIWEGLYEFPLLVSQVPLALNTLLENISATLEDSLDFDRAKVFSFHDQAVVHKLTHRHIHARFWILETTSELSKGLPFSEIEAFPTTVLISDFINAFKNSYF